MKISKSIKTNANNSVIIKNVTLDGTKGKTNGYITYQTPTLIVENVEIADGATMYNVFEGSQVKDIVTQKTVSLNNVTCLNTALTHNVLNVYTPGDDAVISIKNSKFDLNVDKSNIMRVSNCANAKNVTITFENCEWTYENVEVSEASWDWAGLILYQPYGTDAAFGGDTSYVSTWKIIFKNCKYNGEKVTSNNFGKHNQCGIGYHINNEAPVSDLSKVIPMKFL